MQQGSALLSVAAMYSTADAIELQQDVHQLIELLNDACAALRPDRRSYTLVLAPSSCCKLCLRS